MDNEGNNHGGQMNRTITRPMKVKVLYSFDTENKTNCLARIPNVFQIPSVTVGDGTQIGIMALKRCLQAVTLASPELLSSSPKMDYIVYAFDYSELGTPIVGQGMLSSIMKGLNLETTTEEDMITGRVCKSSAAIFNNGVVETLEVKLRLVPMVVAPGPTFHQGVDGSNLESGAMSGFDHGHPVLTDEDPIASFNSFVQLEPLDYTFGISNTNSDAFSSNSFDLGREGLNATHVMPDAPPERAMTAPGSRSGSRSGSPGEASARGSPASFYATSVHGRSLSQNQLQSDMSRHLFTAGRADFGNFDVAPQECENSQIRHQVAPQQFYNEDNQSRKRAKVTRTDWRGRSSFGPKSSDLRVTASTAASMHMYRSIPRKGSTHHSSIDPPPRVPTPIPKRDFGRPQQEDNDRRARRSLLRQASIADSDAFSEYESHYSDVIVSSPEDPSPANSAVAEETPYDIPSSPPVFHAVQHTQPSSPHLQAKSWTRTNDSGYMSERGLSSSISAENLNIDKVDGSNAGYTRRSRKSSSRAFIKNEGSVSNVSLSSLPGNNVSTMDVHFESPGDMNQLPQKLLLDIPPSRQRQINQKLQTLHHADSEEEREVSRDESEASHVRPVSRASLALPRTNLQRSVSMVDTNYPTSQGLTRQSTIEGSRTLNTCESYSPAPSDSEAGRPTGPKRSGSGAARRKVIKERLERSIAKGDMPQFCHHCGAIETPTWRKLYVKFVDGKPSPLDYSEGEGETIGVETLSMNGDGDVTRFVIRKSMKRTKDFTPGPGFEDISVCNPCGLWFGKFRSMRPPDKWHKRSTTRKVKKRIDMEESMPPDDMDLFSEPTYQDTDLGQDGKEIVALHERTTSGEQTSQSCRSLSVGPSDSDLQHRRYAVGGSARNQVAGREVQSSPVGFAGSKASPIQLDDQSPRPTRRLLFPSPRRSGEIKRLDDMTAPSTINEKAAKRGENYSPSPGSEGQIFDVFICGKENVDPAFPVVDMGKEEKSASPSFDVLKTPSKPGSTNRAEAGAQVQSNPLLKTPTPGSRKRRVLNSHGDTHKVDKSTDTATQDFLTSPSSPRYYLRSTPRRRERSSGQRSSQSQAAPAEISPFSKHLAQMLSDTSEPALFTSPPRHWDFSDLPTFTTPGRSVDWAGIDEMLSSEFPTLDETIL